MATGAVEGVYWLSDGGMPVSDIPSELFTHIFYAFAEVDSQQFTISCGDTADTFTDTVREKNLSVKTILSIGGGNPELKDVFSVMARQPWSRRTFIDSSIEQARRYDFSGLDLDWEYPQNADEMNNYATLLAELRAKVEEEAPRTRKTKLLLTAAFYYSPTINWLHATFPVESIRTNLDWVNLMAYDYDVPTSRSTTGVNAALYDPNRPVNTNHGIDEWVANGLPKSKIVLGMPFFGRAWKLVNPSTDFGVGAVAIGPASGPGIDGDGAISYRNIEQFIQNNHAAVVYDTSLVTYYCYAGTTWISYDGIDSIDAKISYAKSSGLLGYFAWQIGNDDAIFTLSNKAKLEWGGYGDSIVFIPAQATQFVITHGGKSRHWNWIPCPSSRSPLVAKLICVWFLEINVEIDRSGLTRGTTYGVYLIYKLWSSYGLDDPYIASRIYLDDKNPPERRVSFLEPTEEATNLPKPAVPHPRDDGWLELPLGYFVNYGDRTVRVELANILRHEHIYSRRKGVSLLMEWNLGLNSSMF